MSDLHKILKEEYEKKLAITPNLLMEMIEEIMETTFATPEVIEERNVGPQTMTLSMIPEIAVSEIGWSDVSTTEAGEKITGPQRKLLEDYLGNIQGSTLTEQIGSLENFYKEGAAALNASTNNRAEVIQTVLSYLVFYKTLTKVITNFNAASAGFSFESFLATLMKGKQIPANTGTIADFTTGDNTPISLKLYAEKTLHVEGSFTDLVNDITVPQFNHPLGNAMRYIVCTKNLEGEGLEQEGSIKFYQFDFTLDNVMDILKDTKPVSQECIRLPAAFREVVSTGNLEYSLDAELPSAAKLPSPEELEIAFLEKLKAILVNKNSPITEEEFATLSQELDWSKRDALFQDADPRRFGGTQVGVVRGISKLNLNTVKEIIATLGLRPPGALKTIVNAANNSLIADLSAAKLANERTRILSQMKAGDGFLSVDESEALYNAIESEDMRKLALRNTLGYLSTYQFSLNKTEARSPDAPTNTEYLGEIQVGAARVEQALNLVRDILNEQVGAIFNSLKLVTDNLNAYFATGLVDDSKAADAIEESENIQTKTEEIRDQK